MMRLTGPLALLAMAIAGQARAQAAPSVREVVVTASTPPVRTLLDRKVYAVTTNLQSTSGTAADVLNNVPSVEVDADGNVSLRGDSNVTILLDGKPSAQFAGATRGLSLQQFPASDIERIEVLTNPPAQYKAEGSAGVINIITKKTRKAGLSGGGQLSAGDSGRFVFGLNAAYNRGPLRLSGGLGLRRDIRERLNSDARVAVDPVSNLPAASQQRTDVRFYPLSPLVRAGIDYDFNGRQSLGASYSRRELRSSRYFDQHDEGGLPPGVSDRHSDGHEWDLDESQDLHFEQHLWRPQETLNLALQRSVTRERERYAYRNTFTDPPADPSFDDLRLVLDLVKTEFSADYDLPLSHDRELKLGYDLEDDSNNFDNSGDVIDPSTGLPVNNPAVTNHFRYSQQVNALYGQYQTPLGPWRLQAGLRVEASEANFLLITGDIPGGRDDFGAYPSLHLERDLGGSSQIHASLGRRITRPDPEALNPFADHQDTHNLRAGNPDLAPQDTWSVEAGYDGRFKSQTFGVTGYYRVDRNGVTDVIRPVSADVVLSTKANLPLSRSAGLELSADGKLGRKLSYTFSGNLFHTQIDATALGAAGLKSTTGLNLKASLDYKPSAADTLQISFTRSDRRLTPQGYVSAINLVNLGYRRQLRPDLALVATLTDVLDGQRFERVVDTPQLHDVYVRHQLGRVALVGLVYTFGAQKKAKPGGFEYDQSGG